MQRGRGGANSGRAHTYSPLAGTFAPGAFRMPYIQLHDKQFPLRPGDFRVGTGADADLRLPAAPGVAELQAVFALGADGRVSIRRGGSGASVRVNGVALGAEPSPLIHGDKIDAGGHELTFADDMRAGSTQFISPSKYQQYQKGRAGGEARPAATSGGRLVSLVDGREYSVTSRGLNIGRDAACDVVVPDTEVSRNHAEIAPGADGYVVIDLSSNGVWVNGERIDGTQLLGRGDIVRVGTEEFRFHADAAAPPASSAPAPARAPSAAAPGVPSSSPGASVHKPEAGPARDASLTPPAAAAAPAPRRGGRVLASLEVVNEGVLKGKRFEVSVPLAHVGRGAHNDIVIESDSVSDSHAKIQKREAGWFVVDMSSTNGTYVGGQRIQGEAQLRGAPDLRFGGIKMIFRPAADVADEGKGTRAIAGVNPEQLRRKGAAPAAGPVAPRVLDQHPAESAGRLPVWIWIVAILLIVLVGFFIMQGS